MQVLLKKTRTTTQVFYMSKQKNWVAHNCSIDKLWTMSIFFSWQCLGRGGGFGDVFCEKQLEASPMSNETSANQLQAGHSTGQNRVHPWWWQHLCHNKFGGKGGCGISAIPEEWEYGREADSPAGTKASEEGAPGSEQRFLWRPW